MLNVLSYILFTIFSTYVLVDIILYSRYEIKGENNLSGGIYLIIFTSICIILSNIVVWMN